MSEQKAVPEIPEDLREMYESSKLDTTMFVGSQIRQLIGRIAALTAERDSAKRELAEIEADAEAERKKYEALREENAALKQQLADEELAFSHANEVIGKLQADVERLSAPVSMGEMPVGERIGAVRFNAIIAARTTPPAKEPK